MSHGGLPPRRPDQMDERTPRIPVPGARTTPIVNKPGTVVTVEDGGVPNMASKSQINISPQVPTAFFTFPANGRIWGAHLTYAIGANGSYSSAAVSQTYARIKTLSGFDICVIELTVSGPATGSQGDGDPTFPGVPVLAGDKLQLDVNNGVTVSNVQQRASCVVYYSIP